LTPNKNISIISIDEKSVNHFGRWPWNRKIIGDLIKKFNSAKVVVIQDEKEKYVLVTLVTLLVSFSASPQSREE
jgi:hypothetical protein